MIYLIEKRFTIERALYILVYQVKCPKMYDKCFCFSCNVKGKVVVEVEGNGDDNVNDNQGTCFADGNDTQGTCLADGNDNENSNDNDNQGTCFVDGNDNQGTCFADGNDNDNSNDNDNQGTCFADGNDNDNSNDNDNQGACFTDDKQESSLSEEEDIVWSKARDSPTKQRDKLCSQFGCGCGCGEALPLKASRLGAPVNSKGNLFINVIGSLK